MLTQSFSYFVDFTTRHHMHVLSVGARSELVVLASNFWPEIAYQTEILQSIYYFNFQWFTLTNSNFRNKKVFKRSYVDLKESYYESPKIKGDSKV